MPTPISACGASMANEEKPKIRVDSTITHSDAGGLSTVIELPESNDPNSHAFQRLGAGLDRGRVDSRCA